MARATFTKTVWSNTQHNQRWCRVVPPFDGVAVEVGRGLEAPLRIKTNWCNEEYRWLCIWVALQKKSYPNPFSFATLFDENGFHYHLFYFRAISTRRSPMRPMLTLGASTNSVATKKWHVPGPPTVLSTPTISCAALYEWSCISYMSFLDWISSITSRLCDKMPIEIEGSTSVGRMCKTDI